MEITTKGFRVDLNRAEWFKSTRSGPNCDNCVEVAFVNEAIAVIKTSGQLQQIYDQWIGGGQEVPTFQ